MPNSFPVFVLIDFVFWVRLSTCFSSNVSKHQNSVLTEIIDMVNIIPVGALVAKATGIILIKIFEIFVQNPIEILGSRIVADHDVA